MEAASSAEKSRSIFRVSLIGEAVVDRRDCKKVRGSLIADKARDRKQNDERASAGCCGAEGICCPAQLSRLYVVKIQGREQPLGT